MFERREKFPQRALPATLPHFDVKLFPQQLTNLPPHGIPRLGKIARLIAPRIHEGYKRGRREKQRWERRSTFLELKRLCFACTAIVSPEAVRKRCFQIETQQARKCRWDGFESCEDEQLSAARSWF